MSSMSKDKNWMRKRAESAVKVSPSHHTEALVLKAAIASRLLLLALIIFWRTILDSYDTSSPLNPDCLSASPLRHQQNRVSFPRVATAIQNSVVWDSVYFVRIAQCGYEYEQTFAFLPLLPLLISLLSRTVLAPLIPLIGERAVLALAGYVVSNIAFVIAAVWFYRLSRLIFKDQDVPLWASILFCFNPASIFYSSIYSESLYSLLSVGGLYYLISGSNNMAVLWFALSGCARSNGVLNSGYFCFQTMHRTYDALFVKRRALLSVQIILVGALRCILIFVPFIGFQAYGYYNICHGRSLEEISPWCKANIPLLYSYIQSHYWGVGFLRYFQLKQFPNFLLASPILSLAIFSIIHYVRSEPKMFFSLGFQASNEEKFIASVSCQDTVSESNTAQFNEKSSTKLQEYHNLRLRKQIIEGAALHEENDLVEKSRQLHVFIIPCNLHLGFMAITAFFVMHVQVATRFLSASPPLYWFASYIMMHPGNGKRWGYIIWAYSTAYILLGSLLFSNFYPFT